MSKAHRKTLNTHRRLRRDDSVVRVAVRVPAINAQIVRDLAAVLRENAELAPALRLQLRSVVVKPRAATVFGIFGSDLQDAYFEGVFANAHRS